MSDDDPRVPEPDEFDESHWPLVKILAGVLAGALVGGVVLPLFAAARGPWDGATLLLTGALGWGFSLLVTLCVR